MGGGALIGGLTRSLTRLMILVDSLVRILVDVIPRGNGRGVIELDL
jgi:hypothetical protein